MVMETEDLGPSLLPLYTQVPATALWKALTRTSESTLPTPQGSPGRAGGLGVVAATRMDALVLSDNPPSVCATASRVSDRAAASRGG
jgi:hypothetical protein